MFTWLWSLTSISDSLTAKIIISIKILFSDIIISPLILSWNWLEKWNISIQFVNSIVMLPSDSAVWKGRSLPLFGIKIYSHQRGNNAFSIQQVDLYNFVDGSSSSPFSVCFITWLVGFSASLDFFVVAVSIGGFNYLYFFFWGGGGGIVVLLFICLGVFVFSCFFFPHPQKARKWKRTLAVCHIIRLV